MSRKFLKSSFINFSIFFLSTILCLVLIETLLRVSHWHLSQKTIQDQDTLGTSHRQVTVPDQWAKKPVAIEGASSAYYWMGKLHVFNHASMRRATPFSSKKSNTYRILVVGDSLTYGQGISEESTYSRQIEIGLQNHYSVEMINLGVMGYESSDILRTIKEYVPLLSPDLILYGVCLNDYLPSGVGQYENNMVYQIPFSHKVKKFFIENTYTFSLASKGYNNLLISLRLRDDFMSDILKDFKNYQKRFEEDVREMNRFVIGQGLPPIVAMVLHQFPDTKSREYKLSLLTEKYLTSSGFRVVPCTSYFKKYSGADDLYIGKWDGHPNEKANKIFSDRFLSDMQNFPNLEKYRKF